MSSSYINIYRKDPDSVVDYTVDWTYWLSGSDSIAAATFTAQTGLTIQSHSFTDTTTTVWLSGGTAGTSYRVTSHVTTSEGRQDDQSFIIDCREL